jgi:acetyl-CoA acetyltransferase
MKRQAAIVGVYESPRREAKGIHPYAIHAECVRGALYDAGLTFDDVDGICTATGDWGEGGASSDILDLSDYLGLKPRYFNSTDFGGGCYVSHAGHAAAAIGSGQANVVVVTYAGCSRNWPLPMMFWDGLTYPAGPGQFEIPYSPTIVASYALFAQRYMHEYGTTAEQLARIAVTCRANAAKNPNARYRDRISVQDVLDSPMIASPLHRLDCCVLTEGGGAFVLVSDARSRECRKAPAWVRGFGEAMSSLSLSSIWERLTTPARDSGIEAFSMAGITPQRIDTAQLYDAFTITALVQLEDLGFCEKGSGGKFVESGAIDADGDLPINTDGGGLSSNQPGRRGMFTVIEAVRQLRGQSPGAQVPDCHWALAHGLGGVMSAGATLILSTE